MSCVRLGFLSTSRLLTFYCILSALQDNRTTTHVSDDGSQTLFIRESSKLAVAVKAEKPNTSKHLALGLGVSTLFALIGGSISAAHADPTDVPTQQLRQITASISSMQNRLQATRGKRAQAQKALEQAETTLANTHTRLAQLDTQHQQTTQKLKQLAAQSTKLEAASDAQKKALAALLNALYRLGKEPELQLLLEQHDMTQLNRYQHYLNAIENARQQRLAAIASLNNQISQNRSQVKQQQAQLEKLIAAQKKNAQRLLTQQKSRQRVLDGINASYTNAQSRLSDLNTQRDQAQATLARIEQEVEAARRAAAKRAAEQRKLQAERRRQQEEARRRAQQSQQQSSSSSGSSSSAGGTGSSGSQLSEQEMNATPQSANNTPQVSQPSSPPQRQLSGSAWSGRWPINGRLVSGYGAGDGINTNGVVLSANAGTPIHALRSGEVVFANWLNGFGYIVIVDHGSSMSIYAHNERNIVSVGDHVRRGTVIATVGDTGGLSSPELYFEVRQNGSPINPTAWASASR